MGTGLPAVRTASLKGRQAWSADLTATSTLRDDDYTVVTVGGSVDARALPLLAAHFVGLIHAGTRHLVVDLSQVGQLVMHRNDVTRVATRVGYESPSQFSREYRRQFGASPSQDAARLRG